MTPEPGNRPSPSVVERPAAEVPRPGGGVELLVAAWGPSRSFVVGMEGRVQTPTGWIRWSCSHQHRRSSVAQKCAEVELHRRARAAR